jgi:5-methyltetrahydropteroyltriglutamate--homocysteine methyltransferase
MEKLFITQEIGSLQRPLWRQKLDGRLEKSAVEEALVWGTRLGVKEVEELVNKSGTGLLQRGEAKRQDTEKRRIIEIASLYAIRMFEVAGLDRLFNGEQPRTEMYDFLARQIDGIETSGTLNSFDANYFKKGLVNKRVAIKDGGVRVFSDEFDFVKNHTERAVKPCLTGPYTMADWSYLEYYRKFYEDRGERGAPAIAKTREAAMLDFAKNVLNPIVHGLVKEGAGVVQIDEPAASTDERDSAIFVEAINESFKGVPGGVERAVHLCYSDYSSLFPALADCVADSYLIEFTNHASTTNFRSEDVDKNTFKALKLFREYGMKVKIGVGVIDIHSDLIETPQVIRDRILYAAELLGEPKQVQVNPDCGLRTRRWDIAFPKLCNMVKGAVLARSEFGGE